MVSLLKLVLDDDHVPTSVFGKYVGGEGASAGFLFDNRQVESDLLTEELQIICQPGSKVEDFVGPQIAEWEAFQFTYPQAFHRVTSLVKHSYILCALPNLNGSAHSGSPNTRFPPLLAVVPEGVPKLHRLVRGLAETDSGAIHQISLNNIA